MYIKGEGIFQPLEIQHTSSEDPIDGGINDVGAILKVLLSRGECMSVDCISTRLQFHPKRIISNFL